MQRLAAIVWLATRGVALSQVLMKKLGVTQEEDALRRVVDSSAATTSVGAAKALQSADGLPPAICVICITKDETTCLRSVFSLSSLASWAQLFC